MIQTVPYIDVCELFHERGGAADAVEMHDCPFSCGDNTLTLISRKRYRAWLVRVFNELAAESLIPGDTIATKWRRELQDVIERIDTLDADVLINVEPRHADDPVPTIANQGATLV